jgi:hypothetical protein
MSTETNHTSYDDQAWKLLDENRSNWRAYDEKDKTDWPCNRKEIWATERVLKKIDVQQLKDQFVIDEYNYQKNLVKLVKKELPNNWIKMLVPLLLLLGVIFFYNWYAHPPKSVHFDSKDWIVAVSSNFVNSSAREPNVTLQRKWISRGTAVTPIAMGQQNRVKVKLPSGEIGYMHAAAFSGIKRNSEIYDGTKVFSYRDNRKTIATLNQIPRIIAIPKIDDHKNRRLKVKTPKGRIGFMYDHSFQYHFCDSLPRLSADNVLPVASTKARKWKGKTKAEIEDHYGAVSSSFGNTSYWEYVRVIGDTVAYRGIIARVNQQGVIDSVRFGKQEKLYLSIKFLPIWRMIASLEPFYAFFDITFQQNDRELNIAWWQKLRSSHWTIRFITWIILVILKILWFFVKISVLFLPIMALGVVISHLEWVSKHTSYRIVLNLTVLVYLSIIIFLLLQNSIDLIALVFLLIGAIISFLGFMMHLGRKCHVCGNWDGEITEKTDFLGKSVAVQYGTKDKLLRSERKHTGTYHDSSSNTTTRHYTNTNYYQRVRTKDTIQYENYKAHKLCTYCGNRWKETYKVQVGEKHEEF